MICQIIVFILIYCLVSGKYKDYITIKVPIPGINAPFMLGGNATKDIAQTVYRNVYTPEYTIDYNPVYTPVPAAISGLI
jgi:hypothetical protein